MGSSTVEQEFVEYVRAHPEGRLRSSFTRLVEGNPLPVYDLQPWPVWIAAPELRQAEQLSVDLVRLARGLPQRFFAGDAAGLAAFYDLPGEAFASLILAQPNGIAGAPYRSDCLRTAEGFRCIELNAGSGLAGWALSALAPLYSEVPVIARFLRESGRRLTWKNTLRALLGHLLREVRRTPVGGRERELNLGIAVSPEYRDRFFNPALLAICRREYAAVLEAADPGLGGELVFCDYAELAWRDGCVEHQGRRLHGLFEQQASDGPAARQAFRSFKMGKLGLFTGPASRILTDKRNLVLLSDPRFTARLAAAEQRLVSSHVPWTRRVVREAVEHHGEHVFLPELLASRRRELVLKRALSFGGRDVVVGAAAPAARWDEAAEEALAHGGWVVQEYLEPRPCLLQSGSEGAEMHDVVWGFFVFGEESGGGILRVLPQASSSGVVNVDRGAQSLPLFEVVER